MSDKSENRCKFDLAWVGQCDHAAGESGFCEKHLEKKCVVCGEQATRVCSHLGQFVCGEPLCDSCEGYVDREKPSGVWGFMNHGHRKKEAR